MHQPWAEGAARRPAPLPDWSVDQACRTRPNRSRFGLVIPPVRTEPPDQTQSARGARVVLLYGLAMVVGLARRRPARDPGTAARGRRHRRLGVRPSATPAAWAVFGVGARHPHARHGRQVRAAQPHPERHRRAAVDAVFIGVLVRDHRVLRHPGDRSVGRRRAGGVRRRAPPASRRIGGPPIDDRHREGDGYRA